MRLPRVVSLWFLVLFAWLPLLVVLVSCSPDAFDLAINGDAHGADARAWFGMNRNVGLPTAFCLTEAEGRRVANLSQPLYTRSITLMYDGAPGFTNVFEWIVRLLLQEVIGYRVLHYVEDADAPQQQVGLYSRTMKRLPESRRVDAYVRYHVSLSHPTKEYAEHVLRDGAESFIQMRGQYSAFNQQGLYVTRHSMNSHPELSLDSWRAYSKGRNVYQEVTLDAMSDRVVALFRNDSWNMLHAYVEGPGGTLEARDWTRRDPADPTSPHVCQPIMLGPSGSIETGCNDPNYPGMYVPPQCYPNPREQCAVLYAVQPNLASPLNGYMQPLIRQLNLSLVLGFLELNVRNNPELIRQGGPWAGKHLLFWSENTQAPHLQTCTSIGGQPCWHRIRLPEYDSDCNAHWTGNASNSDYSCDFPPIQIVKLAARTLQQNAPRADYLIQQFDMTPADIKFIHDDFAQQQVVGLNNFKASACNWLRHPLNKARWKAWISPPPGCDFADFYSTVSACGQSSSGLRDVVHSWHMPKACSGGVALPPNEQISCGYGYAQGEMASLIGVTTFFIISMLALVGTNAWVDQQVRRTQQDRSIQLQTPSVSGPNAPSAVTSSGVSTEANLTHSFVTIKVGQPQPTDKTSVSLAEKLLAFRRDLPALTLIGSFGSYVLVAGCVLLLVYPLLTLDAPTHGQCTARVAVLTLGLVLIGTVTALATARLRSDMARKLDQRIQTRAAYLAAACIAVSTLLFLLLGAGVLTDRQLVSVTLMPLTGNPLGVIEMPLCQPPPIWFMLVHLALHVVWMVGGPLMSLILLLTTHMPSWMTARGYAPTAGTVAQTKSKTTGRGGRTTRPQMIQVHTLAFMWPVWVSMASLVLIITFTPSDYERNERLVKMIDSIILVGVVVLMLSTFLPSVLRRRKVIRESALQGEESRLSRSANENHRSLASLLSDPMCVIHLRRYAERQFDAEAIHFLLAARDFLIRLRSSTLTLASLLMELATLAKEYIEEDAPQQLNVGSTVRESTLRSIDHLRMQAVALAGARLKPASSDVKAAARVCLHGVVQEVYSLVQVNSYPRFLLSSAIARTQQLQTWSEEFEELDFEEQAAMLELLRARMTAAKRLHTHTLHSDHTSDVSGTRAYMSDERRPNNEADVLRLVKGEVDATDQIQLERKPLSAQSMPTSLSAVGRPCVSPQCLSPSSASTRSEKTPPLVRPTGGRLCAPHTSFEDLNVTVAPLIEVPSASTGHPKQGSVALASLDSWSTRLQLPNTVSEGV